MNKKAPLFWLLKKVRRRLPAIFVLAAAYVAEALLGVAFALGTRGVIDSAVGGNWMEFRHACLVQGTIIVGILVCLTVDRHLKDRLMADLDRDWKRELLHGLLHGEYEAVSAYHSGELINRLNNDVRVANEGLLNALPNAVSMVVKLISAFAALVALEPKFALILVVVGLAAVLATGLMRRSLKGLNKKVSQSDGKVSGFLQETLEKLLMVQAMDVSNEMERRADILMEERYGIQRKRKNVSLLANTSVNVLYYVAGFAALAWCAFKLLHGQMSFGSLTAVIQLVNQLQAPFVNLSGVIPQYIAMTAAAERLMELETVCGTEEAKQVDSEKLYADMTAIVAEGLKFSYDRDVVLQDGEFALPKGAFAVVTGPSGAGKSTMLKLMLGIFHPEQGGLFAEKQGERIALDRGTRGLFAYVPQGNLLLSGTLRENLTITKPDAADEEIQWAVHTAAMEEYVAQLPDGLDTVLGESGAGLSEGQAQRLAIARAVLSGAPILLLDEITSALDEETERTVLERICALPGRTCIAVTHRPAALELADVELRVSGKEIQTFPLKK